MDATGLLSVDDALMGRRTAMTARMLWLSLCLANGVEAL
jgi:hypothetical protein